MLYFLMWASVVAPGGQWDVIGKGIVGGRVPLEVWPYKIQILEGTPSQELPTADQDHPQCRCQAQDDL